MYVTSRGGLGQGPSLYGSLAGALGEKLLSPNVQKFLEQVRDRPQDHKRLLLTVLFHPRPIESSIKVTIPGRLPTFLLDLKVSEGFNEVDILDPLKRISNAFRSVNKNFNLQVERELRLRYRMYEMTGTFVRNELLRTRGASVPPKLKPFLLAASHASVSFTYHKVGKDFAAKLLPRSLFQRILHSKVPEAHFTNLGMLLQRYAEKLQNTDAAFKEQVEQPRKNSLAPKKKQKP